MPPLRGVVARTRGEGPLGATGVPQDQRAWIADLRARIAEPRNPPSGRSSRLTSRPPGRKCVHS
eukprot:8123818-Alexandrium_andersonii.AAC.1